MYLTDKNIKEKPKKRKMIFLTASVLENAHCILIMAYNNQNK